MIFKYPLHFKLHSIPQKHALRYQPGEEGKASQNHTCRQTGKSNGEGLSDANLQIGGITLKRVIKKDEMEVPSEAAADGNWLRARCELTVKSSTGNKVFSGESKECVCWEKKRDTNH